MLILKALCLALVLTTDPLNTDFEPARLETERIPPQPPTTLGGGEVLLELRVDTSGAVAEVTVLRL